MLITSLQTAFRTVAKLLLPVETMAEAQMPCTCCMVASRVDLVFCLLYLGQSGFRSFHSCETALTKLVERWTENMENGLLNGIVFIDLRKAFDLVDIDILLAKLRVYNFDDNSLCWFESYLKGRQQCVQFKGKTSNTLPVTHGVPQGSILGPLLFIIFMNDLPLYIDSSFDMYADDSTLHAAARTLEELERVLNKDVASVQQWCEMNRMVANIEKTKSMLVTTYQKEARLPRTELNIVFNDVTLECVEKDKLLGVVVDKHLTWRHHVDKTAASVSRGIALLRRIKRYLSRETRLTYYSSFIQPHLDYCSTVWGLSTHVPRLHILQKMALRVIMDKPKLTHSAPLFKQCNVMVIQDRVKFRCTTLVHKALHKLTPTYMSDMFQYVSEVSSRTTRSSQSNMLYVPKRKLCASRRSLGYNGAKLYNTLDEDTRSIKKLSEFKESAYKNFI